MYNGNRLKSFEDLDCWRACRSVRQYIVGLLKKYPNDEKYRLVDDMLRAARSTTHNIAEGYGRFHSRENIQFCRISRGSLYELKDQIICSFDELTKEEFLRAMTLITKATTLLNGYINYLKKRTTTNN
jgi:four helix bundle protein